MRTRGPVVMNPRDVPVPRKVRSPVPGRKLVIVESPAKARTIAGYLGEGFTVEASVGHIRDLPQPSELPADMKKGPFGKFAVDVDHGFQPYYVVDPDKRKKVAELRKALKDADELYLATDEDREGEAIAWHLLQVLDPKVPVKRMVFHEITREAIQRALASPRELDERLVDAQETRRILDRLYGYEVSPVLWRKVRQGLSAGRVQSVATRMVVERERERMAFREAEYWDVRGTFRPSAGEGGEGVGSGAGSGVGSGVGDAPVDGQFDARLVTLGGARVAAGRDFDDRGALRRPDDVVHLSEEAARAWAAALEPAEFRVLEVETKPYSRKPAAPFTTSTLQQEAARKLRMGSRQTMRVAQALYENGYITYMRTDSPALSTQATDAARRQAADLYGPEYVPASPRVYAPRNKGAQEAHEAIRPAGDHFRTPGQVAREISGDQFRLYELIWKRTIASQMADAKGSTASVRLGADAAPAGSGEAPTQAVFAASGTVITFRGFLAAYEESRDAERYADENGAGAGGSGRGEREARLPQLAVDDALDVLALDAEGHRTSPPPRYTEASLVKALEERGIGRPSTYAATIGVIQDRGYVSSRGQALVPSWLAFAVTRLLEENFDRLVDYDFTAAMEQDLDAIAAGEKDRVDWLTRFYFGAGDGDAGDAGDARDASAAASEGLRDLVESHPDIDAREVNSVEIGDGIVLRVGRYGPYLEDTAGVTGPPADDGTPRRASVPVDLAPDELTVDAARELLTTQPDGDRVLGTDPATGTTVVARNGRYGPYVTEVLPEPELPDGLSAAERKRRLAAAPKPRTASLFRSMQLTTVTIDDALRLLSLPRVVGTDPATGEEITAQNGRYGPYLKKGTDSRTLPSEEALFDVTLEGALAIYAQPKRGRGQAAAAPLRELGNDPTSGKPVVVKDGRFGPYVTDGETNATLRKEDAVESVTLERAAELLAEKRARGPAKRGGARGGARKTTRKSAAKK